ncbi:MAG: alpha/beta fold hydrolase [Myxococcales bacterium]|nr:alpha/beta fold hydrolase [Myxococcales bacterium]
MALRHVELKAAKPGLTRTLVLLHGYGADEHDLLPIVNQLDPRLRAVSLQGPLSLGGAMRAWFNLAQDARGISFDPAEAREGLQAALTAVEGIARDSPKPILLGFSQGAAMALGVALMRPNLAAAVLSLSGVPPAIEPRDLAPSENLKQFPVFAAHGLHDPLLPIELGRTVRQELERLGLAVAWHEYPMGHMVIPEELADARKWLEHHL